MSVRFLVIEGNTRAVREGYRAGFGASAGESYGALLVKLAGGGTFDIIDAADANAALPSGKSLGDYDAAVITGSALHLWKREPETLRQIDLARAVYGAGIPFFGSCWGLQIAAVAAGGDVALNPRGREMGFARRIAPNEAGRAHPMLEGRPAIFDAPCSHLDEVSVLPPDATLLASNALSQVQAAEFRFEGGTFWGVQYHPEYSLAEIAFLIERRGRNLIEEGFLADDAGKDQLVGDLRALDRDPGLKHLAWRYALDSDVMDAGQRATELRNFIDARVMPRAMARAA
jgi:GMP synthase (glutamine-hydrolysing)